MTTTNDKVRSKASAKVKEDDALQHAMMSVYFRSLGAELESRGASIMVVPPEVAPLPLDEALNRLEHEPALLWDAYWRIVRSVPVEGWNQRTIERRYPQAFVHAMASLGNDKLRRLDTLRQHARSKAHFFTGALQASADGRSEEAELLGKLLEETDGLEHEDGEIVAALTQGMGDALGAPAAEFVASLASEQRARDELTKLQAEVGLNLSDFAEDFLETVAFQHFKTECNAPETVLTSSCIVRQDTNTLTTTATVTTLASDTTLDELAKLIDPLRWPKSSSVIKKTKYVRGPFDLRKQKYDDKGPGFREPRLLYEDVRVNWGLDDLQKGGFRNVLAIDRFHVSPEGGVSLPFKLCRSIDSRMMWDSRPGGLLIDGGYLVARPLRTQREGDEEPKHWRVTTRKVLQFSDRAPYSNPTGGMDFGQMLNYLAPAAVTWWLETDFYSSKALGKSRETPPGDESRGKGA
jgi:hypothetical protein